MTIEKVSKRGLSGDWTNMKTKRKGIEVMWEEMEGRLLVKDDRNGKQCCINRCSIFDGVVFLGIALTPSTVKGILDC